MAKNIRQKPKPERWLVSAQELFNAPGRVTPVALQSAEAEEAWWTARAAALGMTLGEFDAWCGPVVDLDRPAA